MTGLNDAAEFLVELISQLLYADALITEQAERIETPEQRSGGSGWPRPPGGRRSRAGLGLAPTMVAIPSPGPGRVRRAVGAEQSGGAASLKGKTILRMPCPVRPRVG